MVTRELEHALDAGQWVLIDTSGDGGPFGFHYKRIAGSKYLLTLSTGGTGFEQVYPVTLKWEKPDELHFMIGIYYYDDPAPMLKDKYDDFDDEHVAVCEAMEWCQHEALFQNVGAALKFADWLAALVK